jgi:hypothetical protein
MFAVTLFLERKKKFDFSSPLAQEKNKMLDNKFWLIPPLDHLLVFGELFKL